MGKRTREDDDQFLNHGKRVVPCGGYFDRLPDDVVIQIVESLNLKDAAKTSILSQRFLRLWKLMIPYKKNLDFQGIMRSNLEKIVNGVMRGHKGPSVDSLTISIIQRYDSFKKWLRFARTKCVKNLDIEFYFMASPPDFSHHGWDKLASLTLRSVHVRKAQVEKGGPIQSGVTVYRICISSYNLGSFITSAEVVGVQSLQGPPLHRYRFHTKPPILQKNGWAHTKSPILQKNGWARQDLVFDAAVH